MESLYPLTFDPIFKERVWGGRNLERLFGKRLPVGKTIGESWEISDRPADESVVNHGPLSGRSLRELIADYGDVLMGDSQLKDGRFPLLIKLLDAEEKLSLQVHPPASVAAALQGEPKTEMWYLADCQPGADLFVGLRSGVTRARFEQNVESGRAVECFHRIEVSRGDAMFLPSGRVHAIGAGNVIFEIQENSDTTYRVHDWDRVGLDGKPRELHLQQSLQSIDFDDYEPALINVRQKTVADGVESRTLVECAEFIVEERSLSANAQESLPASNLVRIIGVTSGQLVCCNDPYEIALPAGAFCLLPATFPLELVAGSQSCQLLMATAR